MQRPMGEGQAITPQAATAAAMQGATDGATLRRLWDMRDEADRMMRFGNMPMGYYNEWGEAFKALDAAIAVGLKRLTAPTSTQGAPLSVGPPPQVQRAIAAAPQPPLGVPARPMLDILDKIRSLLSPGPPVAGTQTPPIPPPPASPAVPSYAEAGRGIADRLRSLNMPVPASVEETPASRAEWMQSLPMPRPAPMPTLQALLPMSRPRAAGVGEPVAMPPQLPQAPGIPFGGLPPTLTQPSNPGIPMSSPDYGRMSASENAAAAAATGPIPQSGPVIDWLRQLFGSR